MIRGCDLSHWQGSIDFDKLATASEFAIVKVSEGIAYTDPMWKTYRDQARRVGMLVGYYHFARPTYGNSAEAEAKYFIDRILPDIRNGEVLVLDFEVTTPKAVSWSKQWLDYVSQNTNGTKPLIYMDQSRLSGYDWTDVVAAGYGLWIAKYDNNPDAIPPSGRWPFAAMKQYTNAAIFPGVSVKTDGDAFYGTHDQFLKYGYYRPSDSPTNPPSNGDDPCKALKDENEALKSAMSAQKKDFELQLAKKEIDCQNQLESYKSKLTAGIVNYIKLYKEE